MCSSALAFLSEPETLCPAFIPSSADGGVVVLDDVFNADWPEVYLGLALYLEGYMYEALQVWQQRKQQGSTDCN